MTRIPILLLLQDPVGASEHDQMGRKMLRPKPHVRQPLKHKRTPPALGKFSDIAHKLPQERPRSNGLEGIRWERAFCKSV